MKSTILILFSIVCALAFRTSEAKSIGSLLQEVNQDGQVSATGGSTRVRRASRIAEIELENIRQRQIAELLRKLFIAERIRQLTAKRSPMPIPEFADYQVDHPLYMSDMKRDLSSQSEGQDEVAPPTETEAIVDALVQLVNQESSKTMDDDHRSG